MEFLGEMLTIAVFPPKRHQFHDANFFYKKKLERALRNIYLMQLFIPLNLRPQTVSRKSITVF